MYKYNHLPFLVHPSLTSIPIRIPLILVHPPLPSLALPIYFPTKTSLLLTPLFPSSSLLTSPLFPLSSSTVSKALKPKAEIDIKTSYVFDLPGLYGHPVIQWMVMINIIYIITPVHYEYIFLQIHR